MIISIATVSVRTFQWLKYLIAIGRRTNGISVHIVISIIRFKKHGMNHMRMRDIRLYLNMITGLRARTRWYCETESLSFITSVYTGKWRQNGVLLTKEVLYV